MEMATYDNSKIEKLRVRDIRFPTSIDLVGSDAVHVDPDYSCAYVDIFTDDNKEGTGLTFTVGRGTEIIVKAVESLSKLVVGQKLGDIYNDFAGFWRKLTSDSQLRWVGPEKGVLHMAVAAIVNALWDLWAKLNEKPLWKFLVDLTPEQLVSTIDFRYIGDVLPKEEALKMLQEMQKGKDEREEHIRKKGYPAYTTAAGWLGYSSEKIEKLCRELMDQGWKHFKIKVGVNLEDDKRRCKLVRSIIGDHMTMMVDANQIWNVDVAISWMKELAEYKPLWIEEPTAPDDVIGHAAIAKALNPLGIGVATGEMAHNRITFKQLLQTGGVNYCQIDACRLGGVQEVLSVYLMAKKFNVPVCPHAGGVGLCEMVQHLQMWDYICCSGTMENRLIEYAGKLGCHFVHSAVIENQAYVPPKVPGYTTEILSESLRKYEYPTGSEWESMFKKGLFKDPRI